MTREEELIEAWCKYRGKCSTEIMQALAFALKWCDEHPHWISVDDELPKNGSIIDGWVLVCEKISQCVSIARYIDSQWIELDGYPLPDEVTHWMPLPSTNLLTSIK